MAISQPGLDLLSPGRTPWTSSLASTKHTAVPSKDYDLDIPCAGDSVCLRSPDNPLYKPSNPAHRVSPLYRGTSGQPHKIHAAGRRRPSVRDPDRHHDCAGHSLRR
ncbi:hypothetical protein H109_07796 [Trichophyton interdigitale MR816]|uniref:Uncharacterized protein n=1 Tax=Trichophyton interdigitale (strain MR816) TaxID=1215338 RepID=A0A059IXC1_TRIIM|nr:hypothetical protein H101_07918 [Trichophyton interdigitale H6]KDB20245.1 hypothetical protein H109_07796 [Trichophyton interdigitale MR816]